MRVPDALFADMAAYFPLAFRVLFVSLPYRAKGTIFCGVGAREERCAADHAPARGACRRKLRKKLPVRWQDAGAKISAYQRRREKLETGAGFAIVQQNAVAAVAVGAKAANERPNTAELTAVHAFNHGQTPSCSPFSRRHPPASPSRHRFCRSFRTSSR